MFKMETLMSSNANDVNLTEFSSVEEVMLPSLSVGGRESKGGVEEDYVLFKSRGEEFEDLDEEDDSGDEKDSEFDDIDDDDDDDDDDDEEDEDEEWLERLRIFEDARKLRKLASFFLHPEKPVECDPIYSARCFFSRSSAVAEEEECANILEDAALLKKYAKDYLHPELSTETTDVLALGRNYFLRPSAVQQEATEYADERARIVEDAMMLKKNAVDYYHPEAPINNAGVDTAMGRNYFTRPLATEQETKEEAEEGARILADAQLLQKHATMYYHPEAHINTAGVDTAMGRNYFTRPSAVEQETKQEADERARILTDAQLLQKNAMMYYHPEAPIKNTGVSTSMGRNYFTRPSVAEQETKGEADECARILADVLSLQKHAAVYYHPEAPINNTGVSTSMGRNYFTRPSATEQETKEEAEERARILTDAQLLKKNATVYYDPELPINNTGVSTSMGRNYFTRPSAAEQETKQEAEEGARILADARSLLKHATVYFHPELPINTAGVDTSMGRNYFTRPSATEQETKEEADERARILADAQLLKKNAMVYCHPESPIKNTGVSTSMGRNYFTRPSATEQETKEEAEEGARILTDAQLLHKHAAVYYHPEAPIINTGASISMGRNYFTRPSAAEQETKEEADERARILGDALSLQKNAAVYYHPEAPINNTVVSTSMGRNYFTRPSATEQETKEETDERARILVDARSLQKHATVYYHPELPINNTGVSTSMGRNYFTRPSATEQETKEEAEEGARILADAQSLKKNATMYYHPEAPINIDGVGTAMGRNYFTRPSAVGGIAEDVSPKVGRVQVVRKMRNAPKKVVVSSSKSITKHVFDGKLGSQNNVVEIPRSASAVVLFNPNGDMGEAF